MNQKVSVRHAVTQWFQGIIFVQLLIAQSFKCFYYNPSYVIKAMKKDFKVVSLKGICIAVPPPFIENFVERYPRLMKILMCIDKAIENYFPFTYCCDQYMITLEKK